MVVLGWCCGGVVVVFMTESNLSPVFDHVFAFLFSYY